MASDVLRRTGGRLRGGDPTQRRDSQQIVPPHQRPSTLRVDVVADATDLDDDTVSYRYAWSVDGKDAGITTAAYPRTERGRWMNIFAQDDKLEEAMTPPLHRRSQPCRVGLSLSP